MVTAIDIANYFIYKNQEKNNTVPDKLKLQKLVYYAQVWSIIFYNNIFFNEQIEAWESGPVIPSLYQYCKNFSSGNYPKQSEQDNIFSDSDLYVLSEVSRIYGDLKSHELRKLSHREAPWMGARLGFSPRDPSNEPIIIDEIRAYYKNFADFSLDYPKIMDISNCPDKEVFITAGFKDGTVEKVKKSEIEQFIIKHKDKLVSKKCSPRRALTSLPT